METILVIEDDEALRKVVQRALHEVGYRVFCAEDGVQGKDLAQRHLPDLILCDVRMDKLDGYGTLEALKQEESTATIPFIFMTGQADHAAMRQGMELGADDYLSKPFTVPELRAAVQARLKRHALVRQQAEKRLADLRANISCALPHELRTPLNGIMGFAELIVTDADTLDRQEIASMATAIRDSAQRLHRVIENTLLYAQLELAFGDPAKVDALRRGALSEIESTVTKCANVMARHYERVDDLRLAIQPLSVRMTEEHLFRVLGELIDNAFKFSTRGTAVEVVAFADPPHAVVTVTDYGRGIKAENLSKVGAYMQFERRFYEQQGSGLGLTIARRLAEIYGGNVSIRSDPGVGCEVTLALPLADANR